MQPWLFNIQLCRDKTRLRKQRKIGQGLNGEYFNIIHIYKLVSGILLEIEMNMIEESSIMYLEGYLWDLESAKIAISKSIETAKKSGTIVAFSISDAFCVDRFRGEFLDLINNSADIIFANELEIKSLFKTDNLDKALKNCQTVGKIFAVTLGDKGAKIIYKSDIVNIKAEIVENLVDTTGAGDLFAAGFLSEYIKSQNLELCGKEGVKMASKIIQQYGARF